MTYQYKSSFDVQNKMLLRWYKASYVKYNVEAGPDSRNFYFKALGFIQKVYWSQGCSMRREDSLLGYLSFIRLIPHLFWSFFSSNYWSFFSSTYGRQYNLRSVNQSSRRALSHLLIYLSSPFPWVYCAHLHRLLTRDKLVVGSAGRSPSLAVTQESSSVGGSQTARTPTDTGVLAA